VSHILCYFINDPELISAPRNVYAEDCS